MTTEILTEYQLPESMRFSIGRGSRASHGLSPVRPGVGSEQFGDRPAVLDDGPGPAGRVEVGGVERHAHVAVDRRRQVARASPAAP